MKRIPLHLVIFAAITIMAIACARIGNPSGGPRDERPPRFVRANPSPNSAGVPQKTERITIDFDELVNVKDAFSKVVVSPPSKSVPRVASAGRRVTVTFPDTLEPNTTYTIDFADAIEDNNEANPLINFSYTFSTGPTIDSLRIAGRVLSALGMEPMQGKIVGVHRLPEQGDTLLLPSLEGIPDSLRSMKSLPLIFHRIFDRVARTDDRGRFSIEGLAPGRYRVFALDDTNSDYLFSSPDEEMAFYDAIVTPYTQEGSASDTIFNEKLGTVDSVVSRQRTIYLPNDLLLRSFLTRRKQQFISNYTRQDSTRLNIIFNAPNTPVPDITLVGHEDLSDWYVLERSANADSLTLWIRNPEIVRTDTLQVAFGYQKLDSLSRYTNTADTLRFTTDRPRKAKSDPLKNSKKKKKDQAEADSVAPKVPLMNISMLGSTSLDIDRPLLLQTDAPLARLDTAAFRLEEKKDTLWIPAGEVIPRGAPVEIRYPIPSSCRHPRHGEHLRPVDSSVQSGIPYKSGEGLLLADPHLSRLARRIAGIRGDPQPVGCPRAPRHPRSRTGEIRLPHPGEVLFPRYRRPQRQRPLGFRRHPRRTSARTLFLLSKIDLDKTELEQGGDLERVRHPGRRNEAPGPAQEQADCPQERTPQQLRNRRR